MSKVALDTLQHRLLTSENIHTKFDSLKRWQSPYTGERMDVNQILGSDDFGFKFTLIMAKMRSRIFACGVILVFILLLP